MHERPSDARGDERGIYAFGAGDVADDASRSGHTLPIVRYTAPEWVGRKFLFLLPSISFNALIKKTVGMLRFIFFPFLFIAAGSDQSLL